MTTGLKWMGIACLAVGLLPVAFAQGGAQSQPVDPTAQAPTSPAPHASDSASTPDGVRMFTGSIARQKSAYVLKSGNTAYNLDDQSQAKQYQGKNVQVMGSLDKSTNTIHVEKIEPSSSM